MTVGYPIKVRHLRRAALYLMKICCSLFLLTLLANALAKKVVFWKGILIFKILMTSISYPNRLSYYKLSIGCWLTIFWFSFQQNGEALWQFRSESEWHHHLQFVTFWTEGFCWCNFTWSSQLIQTIQRPGLEGRTTYVFSYFQEFYTTLS